jgi:hypothetical protein
MKTDFMKNMAANLDLHNGGHRDISVIVPRRIGSLVYPADAAIIVMIYILGNGKSVDIVREEVGECCDCHFWLVNQGRGLE